MTKNRIGIITFKLQSLKRENLLFLTLTCSYGLKWKKDQL